MPQLLPGLDQLIGPNIKQLGESLSKVFQPNKEFQTGLKNLLAQKPELIQSFANIERQTPGTLLRMGFGDHMSAMIAQVPESPEAEFTRKNRSGIVKGMEGKQELSEVEQQVRTAGLQAALKSMAKAGIAEDAGRKILGLDSVTEEEGKKTKLAGDKAELPVKETAAKMELKILENGIVQTSDLSNVDVYKLAKTFKEGKLTADKTPLLAGLFSRPDTAKMFTTIIEDLQEQERLDASKVLANIRANDSSPGGVTATTMFNKAYQSWNDSGKAGSVEAWGLIHTDRGAALTQVEEINQKPLHEQTTAERDLVEAVEADEAAETEFKRDRSRNLVKGLNEAILGLNRVANQVKGTGNKDSAIAPYLAEINGLMMDNAKLGGTHLEPRFGKIPGSDSPAFKWGKDTGLYFVDPEGSVVTVPEALSDIQNTSNKSKDHDSDLNQAIAYLSGIKDKNERQRKMDELKSTPLYSDIKAHFDKLTKPDTARKPIKDMK